MNNGAPSSMSASGIFTNPSGLLTNQNALLASSINTSMTTTTPTAPNTNPINNLSLNMKSRFPRLQECAHFHYEVSTVDIPKNFKVTLCNENDENCKPNFNNNNNFNSNSNSNPTTNNINNTLTSSTISALSSNSINSNAADSSFWFHLQVTSNDKKWIIYRTNENFKYLDKHLHDCIFDRKFSCLEEPVSISTLISSSSEIAAASLTSSTSKTSKLKTNDVIAKQLRSHMSSYLERFCEIAFINPINCGPILNWFEIDNRGNRLFAIDDSPINIPGVAAAVVKKRYVAQGLDEISLDVGNMISVIDMPPLDESVWWRGKKELEVGFFPYECVELIKCNQHLSSNVTEHLPKVSQNQSVRLKHGKLITLLRSFFNTRPARNQLQSKGILKQRVFACDLGEHLSNTQQDVPKILTICTEFIEKHGIVDGIYRHTGLQSNIQRLRNAFDEERFHEIEQEIYINDVHAVSSLLKMYFRELPNPLLTYQLYHKFIKSVNVEDKIYEIHDVVQQLPPPHYRTLAFLMQHLHRLSESASETNMNTKNLAIVWAPNLLKSKEMDTNCMQFDMLHSITLQANISEFLIANADTIFNDKFASLVRKDHKTNVPKYRPISVCYNTGGTKLLSLEEAQDKYKQVGPTELPKYHTVIEIPDMKKKKQKDKKASQNTTANNSIIQPPANIHIQQQFDALQQQQQQLSISSSMNAASTTPSFPTNTNTASTNNTGSSSPAFISLFRNLRGSIKYPNPNINNSNNQTNNEPVANISSTSSFRQSHLNQTPIQQQQIYENDINLTNTTPVSIVSKLNRTNSNSTFKATSPTSEIKMEYSNCISQLQSAAAQAINSSLHQQSSFLAGSNLSPSELGSHFAESSPSASTAPLAPVLYRNNKLNQSLNSNHSVTQANHQLNNLIQKLNDNTSSLNQANPPVLSTFKDSSQSVINNAVLETRKSEHSITNPIPSKRRTIQGQSSILTNSNTLSTFVHVKPSSSAQIKPDTIGHNENNKENCQIHTEDDMQQLVEYINQFEKENITTAVENVASNNNNSSYIEITSIIPVQAQQIGSNQQAVTSMIEIDAIETSSKLRLSASSLSSSAESSSNDANNEYDDIFGPAANNNDELNNERHKPETLISTFKITPNETNPMIVSTNNLNSILTMSENSNNSESHTSAKTNYISSQFIDRRTYIINKVYDSLDTNIGAPDIMSNDDEGVEEDDDNQYEKVLLTHQRKTQPFEEVENDYGEYHNDLLVSTSNPINSTNQMQTSVIKIVGKASQNNNEALNEPIYINSSAFEMKNDLLIRESYGFEVDAIKPTKSERITSENAIDNQETNFDTEIVELNSQINKLLNENKINTEVETPLQVEDRQEEALNNTPCAKIEFRRPKSMSYPTEPIKSPAEMIKRRTTLASSSANSMDTSCKEITQETEDPLIKSSNVAQVTKSGSFRSKSCTAKPTLATTRPIEETQMSESTESVNKSDPILTHQEVRHSFRLQTTECASETNDLNNKRKSSQSFDELNKKKSETSEELDEQTILCDNKPNVQPVKNRQSIQLASSEITNLSSSNQRSMSKSLQGFNEFKITPRLDSDTPPFESNTLETANETNVRSKIKLMESMVSSNSSQVTSLRLKKGERSLSASSNSSSSSKSPPLSPHLLPIASNSIVKSDTACSLTAPCTEGISKPALQTLNNSKNPPPTVMARSVAWQPLAAITVVNTNSTIQKIAERENHQINMVPFKATEIVVDTEKKLANEVIITENINDTIVSNKNVMQTKEKRKTVKEIISKFEPQK